MTEKWKMFRLSQKADYGLILLSALAHPRGEVKVSHGEHPGGVTDKAKFVSISSVAQKNKISPKFLSQIAQDLKKAGIITSREGISGGYVLAKSPSEIKLLDVLRILDGGLFEGKCFEEEHLCVCGAKEMWLEMKKQLEESFGKRTVADLLDV